MKRSPPLRVAVVVGSSLTWRDHLMRGIAGYSHDHGWHVYAGPEGEEEAFVFSRGYRWDGVIVRPTTPAVVRRVQRLGVPAVAVGSVRLRAGTLPRVRVDDAALGRTAARHLMACGLRRFAYCGPFAPDAEDRGPAFAAFLAEHGYECEFFAPRTGPQPLALPWQARRRALAKWVRRIRRPVGVMTWNADGACELVEACYAAGVAVPDEVAIVASGDETAKCELSSPTVTALNFPASRVGFEAAALLDRLMAGEPAPAADVLVPVPGGLIVRGSTATADPADREVHSAAQYIREHVSDPLDVPTVAAHLHVSRSWLERHFRRVLGQSPQAAIREARLDLARRLLVETDWPAAKVATKAGYPTASHFSAVFRAATGVTPGVYRQQQRAAR